MASSPHRSSTVAPLTSMVVASPLGELTIVVSDLGLRAVLWPEERPRRVPLGTVVDGTSAVADATAGQLAEYFEGSRRSFDLPLDLVGTEFQLAVWRSLADIAYGETRTYAQQALAIGRPTAVRAVGAANGRNPVSIVLPCHRVIGASGDLTGFAGGVAAKRWLLDHERRDQRLC